ncbi:MAG: 2,3-bisphosphoglycerate-independent phosphoglycerate mutase [Thermodesulfobacteriota bacterium]
MKPVCLIVLDGWGINPKREYNATAIADTPNLDRLYGEYPWTKLQTSGEAVGLPEGQMGNSEVGHLTLGSGRIVFQELTRITKAIKDGSLGKNPALKDLMNKVREAAGALHLMGLVSDGGVHSHIDHLYALIEAAKDEGIDRVYVHAFLDGRDTPPKSGAGYIKALSEFLKEKGAGSIATVSGRFYAMDRDKRWDRVKEAYDAITSGAGSEAEDPVSAVESAYARGETDEFVKPTVIKGSYAPVSDDDGVLFFNYRADRSRELTAAFTESGFNGFKRKALPRLCGFATMTEYDRKFTVPVLFAPQEIKNNLGEVLAGKGVKQFRVSETEKYAHVTFFFNGGVEKPFPGEERFLIPSVRDVPTYDKKPEMRAAEIAGAAVEKIEEGGYSFILMNIANGDMVGHTGILDAVIKGCEAVDRAVGEVAAAAKKGWTVIVTSDHGNAEQLIDYATGEPFTAHAINPVPFILIDDALKGVVLKSGGGLKDVAPTVLKIMGIEKPAEMEGTPLY